MTKPRFEPDRIAELLAISDPLERAASITQYGRTLGTLPPQLAEQRRADLAEARTRLTAGQIAARLRLGRSGIFRLAKLRPHLPNRSHQMSTAATATADLIDDAVFTAPTPAETHAPYCWADRDVTCGTCMSRPFDVEGVTGRVQVCALRANDVEHVEIEVTSQAGAWSTTTLPPVDARRLADTIRHLVETGPGLAIAKGIKVHVDHYLVAVTIANADSAYLTPAKAFQLVDALYTVSTLIERAERS